VILLAPARAAARVLTGGDGDTLVGCGVGSEVSAEVDAGGVQCPANPDVHAQ
jgi:hypothetical protein